MKITTGFIAVREDGTFLHISERSTHTGHHIDVLPVATIDEANVFNSPRFYSRQLQAAVPKDCKWVPVEVRREVLLIGYGVTS